LFAGSAIRASLPETIRDNNDGMHSLSATLVSHLNHKLGRYYNDCKVNITSDIEHRRVCFD
jgi:hypothetical protein